MAQQYSFPGPSALTDQYAARKDLAGLILRSVTGVPRTGILPRHVNALVSARTDMQVDVAAFEAVAVQFGGTILLANDAVAQVTIATAPASNSRIDVVYVKQNENAAPATDADNSLQLTVATGIPAASPSKPSIPTGAVELATVLMPAGKTATNQSGVVITQTFQYTTLTGGILYCRTTAEMNALVTTYGPGLDVCVLADNSMWTSTGSTFLSQAGATLVDQILAVTPATGWTNGSGGNALRVHILGTMAALFGTLIWAGGGTYNTMMTIPAAARPLTGTTREVGTFYQITGSTLLTGRATMAVATGILGNSTGGTGSMPASGQVYFNGQIAWLLD